MKKQQIILVSTGALLLLALYFFGQTVPPQKKMEPSEGGTSGASIAKLSTEDILQASQSKLTPTQLEYVTRLQHAVVRGDVKVQQLAAYRQLAAFWKDSVQSGFLPFAFYTSEAAKLENSEKSLTFAARLFLENLQSVDNAALKGWMATNAKELFEKALELDPQNDSTKVGLGASYIFGSTAGSPTEVMQGIQRILEVARRDTSNMYAQFMLGRGGIVSGQYDKAIERLTTVVRHQPANIEAILLLADVYQHQGNKPEAVRWYQNARQQIKDPEMIREIDQSIQALH